MLGRSPSPASIYYFDDRKANFEKYGRALDGHVSNDSYFPPKISLFDVLMCVWMVHQHDLSQIDPKCRMKYPLFYDAIVEWGIQLMNNLGVLKSCL